MEQPRDFELLYGTDALEGVLALTEPIDLLATDPPYAFGGEGQEHELSATVAVTLREAASRLRKGRWAIIYCASSWRSTQYMVDSVRGILTPVRFGTWVKPAARTKVRTPGWAWSSVNVIAFRKGKAEVGAPVADLDWIEAEPVANGRRAELPPEVAEWSIRPFVVPDGLAVDPFGGSGALLAAAARLGMRARGFEAQSPRRPSLLVASDQASLFDSGDAA